MAGYVWRCCHWFYGGHARRMIDTQTQMPILDFHWRCSARSVSLFVFVFVVDLYCYCKCVTALREIHHAELMQWRCTSIIVSVKFTFYYLFEIFFRFVYPQRHVAAQLHVLMRFIICACRRHMMTSLSFI